MTAISASQHLSKMFLDQGRYAAPRQKKQTETEHQRFKIGKDFKQVFEFEHTPPFFFRRRSN